MSQHEKIDYVEFPSRDLDATRAFFTTVFDWQFTDFGPEYLAFDHAGLMGGFYLAELNASTANGSALIVFYSETLEATQEKITANGGTIVKEVFSFPGGRRFHFSDPTGNEFAVWSDK